MKILGYSFLPFQTQTTRPQNADPMTTVEFIHGLYIRMARMGFQCAGHAHVDALDIGLTMHFRA